MRKVGLLLRTWLLLDFFGDTREPGRESSALTSSIFGQSFLAFALAAVVFEPSLSLERFAALQLSLSTLLVGVAALADPDREARRLADRQLFGTAPLGRVTLPLAHALHGLLRTALLALGMAIPPAVLCAFLVQGSAIVVPAYLALAVVLAALLAGALQIAIRAVARGFGALRAALAAGTLRALLLGVGFAGFIVGLPALRGGREALPFADLAWAWPPFHAARWLADPAAIDAALVLLAISLGLFAVDGLVGDAIRTEHRAIRRPYRPIESLHARLAGEGPLRGVTAWTSAMLFRSAAFRARVLPLVGMPAAMLALTFAGEDRAGRELLLGIALLMPAMGMPFLAAFLPRAEQEGASLVFATCPHNAREKVLAREGALLALVMYVTTPLLLVALPFVALSATSILAALDLVAFAIGLSVFATSHAVRDLDAIAFTATDDDPRGLDPGRLFLPTLLLAGLGAGFATIAGSGWSSAIAVVVLVMAWRRLLACRPRAAELPA